MAEVDVEKKGGNKNNGGKRNRWWIYVIIAIVAIIILWVAFDPRTDVHRTQDERIPDSTIIKEDTSPPDFE